MFSTLCSFSKKSLAYSCSCIGVGMSMFTLFSTVSQIAWLNVEFCSCEHENKTTDWHDNNNNSWTFRAAVITRNNNGWQQQFDVIIWTLTGGWAPCSNDFHCVGRPVLSHGQGSSGHRIELLWCGEYMRLQLLPIFVHSVIIQPTWWLISLFYDRCTAVNLINGRHANKLAKNYTRLYTFEDHNQFCMNKVPLFIFSGTIWLQARCDQLLVKCWTKIKAVIFISCCYCTNTRRSILNMHKSSSCTINGWK